jgi:tRNA 2-thiouridine synthesizing protein E
MPIEVSGKTIETDEEGYLADRADWNEDVAKEMARLDSCDLSENHWEVIVLTKAIGKKLGADKGNSKYLYELFPYGPAKQACKYAGLPKPTGCV